MTSEPDFINNSFRGRWRARRFFGTGRAARCAPIVNNFTLDKTPFLWYIILMKDDTKDIIIAGAMFGSIATMLLVAIFVGCLEKI